MNTTIAIYDKDSNYSNLLMDYLKKKYKFLAQSRVFTNLESLKEYLKEGSIHILLLGEEVKEDIIQENAKYICLLSEGNFLNENEQSDTSRYPTIYKFQSAEKILEELFSYFPLDRLQGKPQALIQEKELIGVFSRDTGISLQGFALSLAQEYSKSKKTLYITLSEIQALEELMSGENKSGLSEVIYYLKQNPSNLLQKVNSVIKHMNTLDIIPGAAFGPDVYELSGEDIMLLLDTLNRSDYEVIVIEASSLTLSNLGLLRECSKVFLLEADNCFSEASQEILSKQLTWAGWGDIVDKFQVIRLGAEEQLRILEYLGQAFSSDSVLLPGAAFVTM
ncbi:hypothetical protein acsn021_00420 [Anaerocolumna cellulosilytica]|uniref:Uncharacterized protein n=1 Tax=Anaerocolumna cellulosilytica TaxID=433286 RepID=A0A6S6QM98_9FIRM|nr:hypothetical protein [Anaerocolumna cellulosilytica]MBB5196207.1 hypothetical protein [Anaerocolumna cellulosilytica]BCJ92473.1 hypothetical protein acsn021_00420 [Anaerocolumna cellulosilytica]